jgi:DNA ligase 1
VYVGLRPDGDPHAAPPTRKKEAPAPEPAKAKEPTKPPVAEEPVSAPVPSGGPTMATITKRYFECVEGGASKFWEVWMEGKDVTTNWGKIGTAGQTKTKNFADEAKAKKEYDKLLAEKTGKGYAEKPRPA